MVSSTSALRERRTVRRGGSRAVAPPCGINANTFTLHFVQSKLYNAENRLTGISGGATATFSL